jgi:hypothetical protein
MLANSNDSNPNRVNRVKRGGGCIRAHTGHRNGERLNVGSGLHRHNQKYHAPLRRANELSQLCSDNKIAASILNIAAINKKMAGAVCILQTGPPDELLPPH